jgi:uncharacterized protein YrzB (UPF0473 family)
MKKYSVFDSSDKVCYYLYIIIFSGGTEMSDFDLSDIEEMQVSLELEDGSTLECEVIYIFEWNGDDYAALTPVDESIEEIYFFGIQIDTEGDQPEITLLQIEDDETLDAISDAFDEMLDEEEFGEDDEEDDDDGRWDEFIDKKLD